MKQLGNSLPRVNDTGDTNRKATSELLLVALALTLAVGLFGFKPVQRGVADSAKPIDPAHAEMANLSNAITDLRSQNADLSKEFAGLRTQAVGLGTQNTDLRAQNLQLRQALGTALDAQEQLTNEVGLIRKELRTARDDLSLVRQQLHDLELERETKPIEPGAGRITAQKPQ
jgi:chromosome segregation ATPase